jgi:chromosome segregation ATPase
MSAADRSAILSDGVIDDDELAELSKNDLREMIQELNKEVIDKEEYIQQLEKEANSGKKKRGKGDVDRDLATLEAQNNSLSDKLQKAETEREQFQEELANARAQMSHLMEEKKQLELQLKYPLFSIFITLSIFKLLIFPSQDH